MKKTLLTLFVAISAMAAANATIVFDSYSGGASSTNRSAESSPGTYVTVAQDILIESISVLVDLNTAGNLKFVIFDHATHIPLYISNAQAFADNGMAWKQSASFTPFLLQAGKSYDIGAISDVGGYWRYDGVSDTMNGITSITGNPNFYDFAAPTQVGHASADAAVRLHGVSVASVPDASTTLPLLGMSLVALVGLRKRARK